MSGSRHRQLTRSCLSNVQNYSKFGFILLGCLFFSFFFKWSAVSNREEGTRRKACHCKRDLAQSGMHGC